MPVHNIYKPIGWSPLDVIEKFREMNPEFLDVPITYAGRLDPMAEGVLILLSGEERFEKDRFMGTDKTYQATFLFGVETDSYDCLGLIEGGSSVGELSALEIESFLVGAHNLPFPVYSSYRVKGRPLHYWAQEGPVKEMEVLSVDRVEIFEREVGEVRVDVLDRVIRVQGDFRQEEIGEAWKSLGCEGKAMKFLSCALTVTSGTYVRALAHEMGEKFGCGCVLYSLERVRVGEYLIDDSIRIDF